MRASRPPARRRGGTSKALPIVVGAGLAVGVFAGLVIVRGTGSGAGQEDPQPVTTVGPADAGVPVVQAPPDAAPPPDAPPPPDAGPPMVTLTFDVAPADLEGLVITVDDEPVEGPSHRLALPDGKKRVSIVARASGYQTWRKSHTITEDTTVDIALRKRSSSPGTTGGGSGKKGPGGIIDL